MNRTYLKLIGLFGFVVVLELSYQESHKYPEVNTIEGHLDNARNLLPYYLEAENKCIRVGDIIGAESNQNIVNMDFIEIERLEKEMRSNFQK